MKSKPVAKKVTLPPGFTPITRSSRQKLGKKTVSFDVWWLAVLIRANKSSKSLVPMAQQQLWKLYCEAAETGNGEPLRELLHCVVHGTSDLSPRQRWLADRLFRDESEPWKQTDFLTMDEIMQELEAYDHNLALDPRRVWDDLKRIGARTRHSKKRSA